MTDTHNTADIHQEEVVEAHIVACLTSEQGHFERDFGTGYSAAYCHFNSIHEETDAWQS